MIISRCKQCNALASIKAHQHSFHKLLRRDDANTREKIMLRAYTKRRFARSQK